MDEQELELLRESMERTETEEGSIGLANVHQRIRLFTERSTGCASTAGRNSVQRWKFLPVRYQSEIWKETEKND